MVFSSDLLDALTQDFFARKGNSIEEPLHVEDIKVRTKCIQKLQLSFVILRFNHSLIALDMKELLQVYGNNEKNTAPQSFSRPGESTAGWLTLFIIIHMDNSFSVMLRRVTNINQAQS